MTNDAPALFEVTGHFDMSGWGLLSPGTPEEGGSEQGCSSEPETSLHS
jgi:hypothetical protein